MLVNGTTQLNGSLSVFANANVAGNIKATSYIRGGASGQLVNTYVANVTSGNVTTSGSTVATLATVTYTPVTSTTAVNLLIEFHADYSVSGSGSDAGDSFQSSIVVGSTTIATRTQHWGSTAGSGTRSGVIFPITGLYNQSGINPLTITVKVAQTVGDDTTIVYENGSDSALIKISEYIA